MVAALWAEKVVQRPYSTFLGSRLLAWPPLLAAVDSTRVQAGLTLAADCPVAAVLLGELMEGRLSDAAPKMKHQVQDGLFLDITV